MQNSSSASNAPAMLVHTTLPSEQAAKELAHTLLTNRLVACASVGPAMTSIYSWQGKTCEDPEHLLTLKTTPARTEAVGAHIKQHHPYELPEILFVPADGDPAFLEWIEQCVSQD